MTTTKATAFENVWSALGERFSVEGLRLPSASAARVGPECDAESMRAAFELVLDEEREATSSAEDQETPPFVAAPLPLTPPDAVPAAEVALSVHAPVAENPTARAVASVREQEWTLRGDTTAIDTTPMTSMQTTAAQTTADTAPPKSQRSETTAVGSTGDRSTEPVAIVAPNPIPNPIPTPTPTPIPSPSPSPSPSPTRSSNPIAIPIPIEVPIPIATRESLELSSPATGIVLSPPKATKTTSSANPLATRPESPKPSTESNDRKTAKPRTPIPIDETPSTTSVDRHEAPATPPVAPKALDRDETKAVVLPTRGPAEPTSANPVAKKSPLASDVSDARDAQLLVKEKGTDNAFDRPGNVGGEIPTSDHRASGGGLTLPVGTPTVDDESTPVVAPETTGPSIEVKHESKHAAQTVLDHRALAKESRTEVDLGAEGRVEVAVIRPREELDVKLRAESEGTARALERHVGELSRELSMTGNDARVSVLGPTREIPLGAEGQSSRSWDERPRPEPQSTDVPSTADHEVRDAATHSAAPRGRVRIVL